MLEADHYAINSVPPPVVLQSVSVDDRTFAPSKVKEIAPGHSRLSFEYAGLSYAAPQKVEFTYKLDGFDKNWVDAGARRVAYYTNVPPGKFMFRVKAWNGDGVWNGSGIAFPLGIAPHFYQTWWFDFFCLLMMALLGYGIYYWRLRQVEKQFDLVLRERNRIAREIHDTLAQGFVAVSVQLELVSRLFASSGEAAHGHLDQARKLVRQYLGGSAESIWQLRSQDAEAQGLVGRFSKLARELTESSGVKVQLEVHGTNRGWANARRTNCTGLDRKQ